MKKTIKNKNIKGYYNGELAVKANPTAGLTVKGVGIKQKNSVDFDPYIQAATGGMLLVGQALSGLDANVSTAVNGMLTGAQAGMAFGPAGAGVGAGVGLIAGSMGHAGSVNEETGELTENSGIAGMFGHSKEYLLQKQGRIKSGIAARLNSELVASDYYSMYGNNGFTMAAEGGIVPTTKAYLSKGELVKDSQGIHEVPGANGYANGEDDVLANVEVGAQVLSNKLKVPGTNKTYAQMGKKLMKPNKQATDKYAEGTMKANEIIHKTLLKNLEMLKNSSSTGKYKNGTPGIDLDKLTPQYGRNFFDRYYNNENSSRPITYSEKLLKNMQRNSRNISANNIINNIADYTSALASPLANILTSKPELVQTYTYSPKFGPTSFDINPYLQEATNSNAIARYNLSRINPNTGAGMAYGLLSAVNRNKAFANAYSTKLNAENLMATNNAGIYNQWGNLYANARHVAAVEQALNDATYRNIVRQGIGDASTNIQLIRKDKRLGNRDLMMANMMKKYLSQGMTKNEVDDLYSTIYNLYK